MKTILSILLVITTNVYAQTKDTSWTSYNKEGIISVEYDIVDNPYHKLQTNPYPNSYEYTQIDTIKVIMQVSDTGYLYNDARDTKIYWYIGYKVIGDYDTYYLDILKQPLRKSIIVWLDQNL